MRISPITLTDCEHLAPFQPAGWDDVPGDYRSFVSNPIYDQVKGVVQDELVAIGAIIYHGDTAWLAKIIVHPEKRNQGYGKAFTQGLIDRIDRSRYRTIYLDATDMGFPVYASLGFEFEMWYQHYERAGAPSPNFTNEAIRSFRPTDGIAVKDLDRRAYGEDRSALLAPHLDKALVVERHNEVIAAFFPTLQQGPIVALDATSAGPLVRERLRHRDKAQVPMSNIEGMALLEESGCERSRRSRRMFLGERRDWRPELIFNRTSGQLG